MLEEINLEEYMNQELYRTDDIRKGYVSVRMINCQFIREKYAGYQLFVTAVFNLFKAYFKEFRPCMLTDGALFFKITMEYYNFNSLRRYEVYNKENLFNSGLSIHDFDIDYLTENDLKALAKTAKSNWSYYFFSLVLNHLDTIWFKNLDKKYIVRRIKNKLARKWVDDLEFGQESANTFVKTNYEWLLMNHHTLPVKIWKILKNEVKNNDYLLDYIMLNPNTSNIIFNDLFDSFRHYKPSPSKCDKSLNRDMRLKKK